MDLLHMHFIHPFSGDSRDAKAPGDGTGNISGRVSCPPVFEGGCGRTEQASADVSRNMVRGGRDVAQGGSGLAGQARRRERRFPEAAVDDRRLFAQSGHASCGDVCLCVRVPVCLYVCMRVVPLCACVHVHVCMCMGVSACVCACVSMHLGLYVHNAPTR